MGLGFVSIKPHTSKLKSRSQIIITVTNIALLGLGHCPTTQALDLDTGDPASLPYETGIPLVRVDD